MDDKDQQTQHEESHANAEVDERQLFNTDAGERSKIQVAPGSADGTVITWEASEYIHHSKSLGWYLILTAATLLLGSILYLLLRDILSLVVVAVMYLVVAVYASKEPRILRYSVSATGLSIGEKHFEYKQFRSFSVLEDTGVPSVAFAPTQRFMPSVSIFFAPDDADRIIAELTKFLPHEQTTPGPLDRAILKLRF